MYAFLLSTAVIFVAELGDKSQLMAMTFATRYRVRDVLIGITAATALVHLASVGIGYWSATRFAEPARIAIVAGVAFLGFAAWTLRGDELTEDEADKARSATGAAILAVGVAFFLAELGDKTMLATITLATQEGWLGTWIGSTVGMVAADALAIVVGAVLGKHLPERAIKYGAAAAVRDLRPAAHRRRRQDARRLPHDVHPFVGMFERVLPEPSDRHDLAGELADRAVADDVAGPRRVEDPVAADVDRDVVRAAGAGVAEEDQVAGLLVGPGDALAGADLVAGVVGEPDASAGGLVGGVEDEAGAVEAAAGGAVEVAAAPDVGLADL